MWEGALIAVFANFLVSLSLIVQKHAHMKNEVETARATEAYLRNSNPEKPVVVAKGYWQLKWWWLGISINAAGELGNLIAYGYAPTIVVAPLGATTVMFNSFFSVFILKEKFRVKDVAYLISIFAGIVLIVYANNGDPHPPLTVDETISQYFNTWQCIFLFSLSLVAIAGLQIYIKLRGIDSMLPALWNSAIISMYTVLCSKAAIMWMRAPENGKSTQLPYALLWIMIAFAAITAVWSMHYLQMALQAFEASLTIPTFFTLFTFCCIAGAALAFQEFSALSAVTLVLFAVGLLLAVVGVFLLARRGGSIAETAITQALHQGLVLRPSPALRRCQTSGGRIFAETADIAPTRLVYQQDLESGKTSSAVSPVGCDEIPGAVQSFAEVLLMQVSHAMRVLHFILCFELNLLFFVQAAQFPSL
jgi:magnesium transporter